jgi:RNA polymerase sigma-70 factor (ECF subfamily)
MTLERHSRTAYGQPMTDPIAAGDDTLLLRIKAGDEDAFIELYRNRQRAVYSFALQMSGSRSVAEDVTQEVFLALMREVKTFDPERGSLSGYLYGITRNMVLDQLKRGRLDVSLTEAGADDGRAVPPQLVASGDPLGDLTRGEAVESLRKAILALPEHYREVVVLCDLHEMDYARAAQVLKCAVGTVRSRLHRARELLLNKMGARRASEDRISNLKPLRCAL